MVSGRPRRGERRLFEMEVKTKKEERAEERLPKKLLKSRAKRVFRVSWFVILERIRGRMKMIMLLKMIRRLPFGKERIAKRI
jgi:hypothetical protein